VGGKYIEEIVNALLGNTGELAKIPRDRLDWAGPGAVLELYDKASALERDDIILAMGHIILDETLPPHLIAQLIHVAASLDLAQVEVSIRRLEKKAIASEEPVKGAINNYLAFRQLRKS